MQQPAAITTDLLLQQDTAGARIITLNRPQQRNALSDELIANLHRAIVDADKDPAVRVLIIAGNGPGFCAGHDLHEVRDKNGIDDFRDLFARCSEMMLAITNISKPVIAAVHGIATAAGCQLVCSCDLAVASEEAKFATPGVHIGLFCSTPMVALSRKVGRNTAMKMLLTGEAINAHDAVAADLINEVVAADHLMPRCLELAALIAAKSPLTLAIGKEAFYKQCTMEIGDAYQYASEVMAQNMLKKDAQEGITAFVEKRPPKWSGE